MTRSSHLKCPSYQPELPGSEAFAIVAGTAEKPEVAYLKQTLPVTDELLAKTAPVDPTEVFRFTGPCAGPRCRHFDRETERCTLVERAVSLLPEEAEKPPACAIRGSCVWWSQEGAKACSRCPRIVSLNHRPSDAFGRAARPPAAPARDDDARRR